jgi:maleate cis-trans isomerase
MGEHTRLGIIYPGGAAEQEYYQFAESRGRLTIYLVVSRIGEGIGHSIPSLMQTASIGFLLEAARRLVPLQPDSVMWACTSGSFVVGRAGAEAQVKAIHETVQSPTSSTSLAFVHALEHLGIRRVAIAATYPREASEAFQGFLREFEIESLTLRYLGAEDGFAASEIPPERVKNLVRAVDTPEAEAILVPDTALPSLNLIHPLEEALGKPVLTANQVTLWEGLRLAGAGTAHAAFGRLLAA